MPVKIRIPTPLRTLTNGADMVSLSGASVGDVLDQLSTQFSGMNQRLFKTPGELNRFINIYVNDEDIRFLDNLTTPIKDGDEVSIVPAIAGG
jgi:molybdopterin synthase sulfur carrier subunit